MGFRTPNECSRSDYSSAHTSKTIEQTYCSSSSHDSRGEGMSVELSSEYFFYLCCAFCIDLKKNEKSKLTICADITPLNARNFTLGKNSCW